MASQELEQMFDKFRKVKRKTAQTRISQAVGAGAETMRTGRSMAATLADRAPSFDTMSAKEKMLAKQQVVESIAKQEQWAFDKALEERLNILRENNGMTRAALAHIASLRASDVSAAGHAANLKVRELEFRQVRLLERAKLISTPTKSTGDAWGRAMSTLPTEANRVDAMYKDFLAADPMATAGDKRQYLQDAKDDVAKGLADNTMLPVSPQDLAAAFEAEVNNLEPGQSSQFLKMAAQELGMTEDEVMSGLDRNTVAALERQHDEVVRELDANNTEYLGNNVKLAEAPSWAYGKRPDPRVLQQAQQAAQQGLVMGTPQPVMEPGAPGESLETDPQMWTGMYGVQGIKPAGTAYDRTLQTLDLIDQYPEHPPLQEAKSAILQNQEFKNYMSSRGYQDEQFAFKEMNREMRIAKKQKKQADRVTRKINVEQGVTKARGSGQPDPLKARVRRERAEAAATLVGGGE